MSQSRAPRERGLEGSLRSFREEVIWLAGILEGEGYFGMPVHKRSLLIVLGMTDRDIVEHAHRLTQASGKMRTLLKRPPRKPLYAFELSGSMAAGWMMMLYPFLGQRRREKIRKALCTWRSQPIARQYRQHCPRGHPYDVQRKRRHGRWARDCGRCARAYARAYQSSFRSSFRASPAQPMLL